MALNFRFRFVTRIAFLALAICALVPGAALAGPLLSWSWNAGDAGDVDDTGGVINWVDASFDLDTRELAWTANFGAVPDQPPETKTQGFSLAIKPGGGGPTETGELAVLYFDGSRVDPVLTGYAYNGMDTETSYLDGSPAAGMQPPDRIASSTGKLSETWALDLFNETNGDGTVTMGFRIDAGVFLDHSPEYADLSTDWLGVRLADTFGLRMTTYAGYSTTYFENYLNTVAIRKSGHLNLDTARGEPTDPIPEPATVLLLGLGSVAGALGARRRSRG